ncbi:hypothetical protein T12_1233 [Trichinella patagoniensis]|uniref:Uncharacterized protein n=1 Tax=Trichinella patagoniensis TaxID=990121 RepID=A0A0V0ZSF0_9BILA|nr:hypothetical protein T12_1233 [Trichinella patagoniensis]
MTCWRQPALFASSTEPIPRVKAKYSLTIMALHDCTGSSKDHLLPLRSDYESHPQWRLEELEATLEQYWTSHKVKENRSAPDLSPSARGREMNNCHSSCVHSQRADFLLKVATDFIDKSAMSQNVKKQTKCYGQPHVTGNVKRDERSRPSNTEIETQSPAEVAIQTSTV